ncbi:MULTISPECIES: hypothetical protein [Pseudoxanthomonas]|uniref:Uncharacterized protein n=1 Tax=Pseudoxanthomonas winnipegensis TaxID=2480810 RepID=A0A4Q8LAX2_9GAMM|nr:MULTISPECIES: hypothetical protein [Pseudoxanthomonas]TAA25818.1 hypothetical protein EA660_10340 [Pseudoxanthomonas winnipegensis]TMN20432.1 hypothetical protein FF950_08295 [Pseudoxanthomonas sp. X-1]UAY74682.1 hypothetical protein LAJ50_20035 [Pseudoxanthomonas sp. X-1]
MREVIGTLEELGLLGHTVSIGAIHGPPRIDAAGTCALVVSVRAYPDWLLAAAPLLDRRGLVARVRDDDTEVHMPPGVAEAGVNISSLD